ncbi:AraC family transcriptional regulator [Bacteroides cellulosilyticus]|uniref:AraC family transcriptional regulator n=1 Tax=Bacteroides cellulosilyticus TaxID=246787 RepID=UPI003568A095
MEKRYIRRMDTLAAYKVGITVLIPVFSALTCGTLVALSLRDCLTQEECRLKKIMLVYLSLAALGWYMTFCYEFHPVLFTHLHVLCLLSFVLPSIFFYRIVRYLTRLGEAERFPSLHYLLPGLLAGTMLVWSLAVPFGVQLEIVTGKAQVFPDGYEAYARFFTLKPLLRVIFGMAYYILTIAVLVRFCQSQRTNDKRVPDRRIAGWMVFLVGISVASLFSSLLPTLMPRATILHSLWTLLTAAAIAFQHVLLSYHIIRRKYRIYDLPASSAAPVAGTKAPPETGMETAGTEPAPATGMEPAGSTESAPQPDAKPPRRHHSGKLTRVRLEAYFRHEKPWLDPACKIADLVEVFDVNRSALSGFINRTYGMNFNRYLNGWRLRELDRLRSLPSNRGKSTRSLVGKAGFDNYRTYLRAVAAEREAAEESGSGKGGTP